MLGFIGSSLLLMKDQGWIFEAEMPRLLSASHESSRSGVLSISRHPPEREGSWEVSFVVHKRTQLRVFIYVFMHVPEIYVEEDEAQNRALWKAFESRSSTHFYVFDESREGPA